MAEGIVSLTVVIDLIGAHTSRLRPCRLSLMPVALIKGLILVLTTWLVGCDGQQVHPRATLVPLAPIVWRACDGADHALVSSRCGRYYPNSHGVGGAGAAGVYITFAILTPHSAPANAAPVVFMAGGPGEGGNTQGIKLERWRYWLLDNPIQRPLIVWDSRGNEGAWGYFECEAYRLWSLNQLIQVTAPASLDDERRQLQLCVDRWRQKLAGQSFQLFNSEQNARDILGALEALEYSVWHVMSVSYGSRVAQWLAALAPKQTQSLLLDSPYSWQTKSLAHHQRYWWQGLERFFTLCDEQASCAGDRPMAVVFDAVIARLDKHPLKIKFKLENYQYTAVIGAEAFAHLLFALLYDPAAYQQVAHLLVTLAAAPSVLPVPSPSHSQPWPSAAPYEILAHILEFSYGPKANPWLYWLTQCNDNASKVAARSVIPPVKWRRFLTPGAQQKVCELTGAQPQWRPPPSIPWLPVVVMSGALDPVTPTLSAQALAQKYGGVFIQAPKAGHGVLLTEACDNTWFGDYWQSPKAAFALWLQPSDTNSRIHTGIGNIDTGNTSNTATAEAVRLSALPYSALTQAVIGPCRVEVFELPGEPAQAKG
ncbi:alpha/beta hydrolase [Marinagarivorans algicola]|uniref:alpha/beta hydrolase n=1 Tax=Marinagarivorans algicola TaxID=1513270 RepID=UPI003736DD07